MKKEGASYIYIYIYIYILHVDVCVHAGSGQKRQSCGVICGVRRRLCGAANGPRSAAAGVGALDPLDARRPPAYAQMPMPQMQAPCPVHPHKAPYLPACGYLPARTR